MNEPAVEHATPTRTDAVHIGAVSFLNTLPLIDGLDDLADVQLRLSVPSRLLDQLLDGEVDLALCSCIDYQRSSVPLKIIPAGMLGCDGPTLTVRLYSMQPLERLHRVYCDTDSHTSIALMSIILAERYGVQPELVPYGAREHVARGRPVDWPEAMLLIGDKVVTDSPPAVRYPHGLDLGEQWREMTGLPFAFAVWMARADADEEKVRLAAAALDRQRRHNVERLDRMVHERAAARGWPRDLAAQYLKRHLRFDFSEDARQGMERFFERAAAHGLIDRVRPIETFGR